MTNLLGIDDWIKQIDETIDRLKSLTCDKCLETWLDRMISNNIISDWGYIDYGNAIEYHINGKDHIKEL